MLIKLNFACYVVSGLFLLAFLFVYYLKIKKPGCNFWLLIPSLLSLSVYFLMLAIASHTFILMDNSAKETMNIILDSSQKQINEFKSFIEELKTTNAILESVSTNLKLIAGDIADK